MADGWRERDAGAFNSALGSIEQILESRLTGSTNRSRFEFFFNQVEPFYLSMQLYALAFLAICALWLGWSRPLHRAIFAVLCAALLVHTFGMAARVYLSGYAPVTNLYSSAVFVGWGAVLFSVPLERARRDGLAGGAAALTGFVTLVIAHNLAVSGGTDTMENGALMIVIWCALMLHVRRIRMVGPRGYMQLAVGGGMITSWSWFGTNMLGVGLHSYGFMDKAFVWMMVYWLSQLAIIAIAAIPPSVRRSPIRHPTVPREAGY